MRFNLLLNKFCLELVLAVFVFGTQVRGLPTFLNLPLMSSLFLVYVGLVTKRFRINKEILAAIFPVCLSIVYGVFLFVGKDSDLFFEKELTRNLIYIFAASCLALLLIEMEYKVVDVLRVIAIYLVINSFIIILCFFYPKLQDNISSVFIIGSNKVESLKRVFTFSGFLPARGASGSILCSLYFLYLPLAWANERSNKIVLLTGGILVFISMMLVGRSGIISLVLWYVFGSYYTKNFKLIYPLIIIGASIYALSFFVYSGYFDSAIGIVLSFFLEPIIVIFFEGGGVVGTNETFFNMVYLPESLSTIFFGDGTMLDYSQPLGFLKSDSGYIRWIYEQGLIGVTIYLICFFCLVRFIPRKTDAFIYLSIVSVLCFLNIKEPFLFKPGFIQIVYLIYFVAAYQEKEKMRID